MHPSSSSLCADPLLPQQKSSSVSLVGSGKRRVALSDASNVVVADVTSSRPNHHRRQKRIATNGRKKNAPIAMMESTSTKSHRDLDDVQQKGRITKERKEVFLLDALLDELDGDCALYYSHTCISFFVFFTQNAFDERGDMSTSFSPYKKKRRKKRVDLQKLTIFFTSILFYYYYMYYYYYSDDDDDDDDDDDWYCLNNN